MKMFTQNLENGHLFAGKIRFRLMFPNGYVISNKRRFWRIFMLFSLDAAWNRFNCVQITYIATALKIVFFVIFVNSHITDFCFVSTSHDISCLCNAFSSLARFRDKILYLLKEKFCRINFAQNIFKCMFTAQSAMQSNYLTVIACLEQKCCTKRKKIFYKKLPLSHKEMLETPYSIHALKAVVECPFSWHILKHYFSWDDKQ